MVKPRHNFVRGTFLFVLDGHCMRHKNRDKNDSNKCKSSMISRKFGRCHTRQAGVPQRLRKRQHRVVTCIIKSYSTPRIHFGRAHIHLISQGAIRRGTRPEGPGEAPRGKTITASSVPSSSCMQCHPFSGKSWARASAWLVLCSDWGLLTFARHAQTNSERRG